ncbi:MAG: type II secretion pathway protein GspD [Nitrosomonas sp.]|nr:type II secretion pathway protein GspD [Nitrosomonas sp.]MDP1950852.1 type II secretion pathway protein GspD [Nitrosomonas sp.]
MRIWRYVVIAMLLAVIAGCAINNKTFSTRNIAFTDGQQLIAQGEFESGLQSLEQAAREEPANKEIRTVLARQREEVIGKLLFDAEETRLSGDLDSAEQKYYRVLALAPLNERANAGLGALSLERHHIASVNYAKELLANDDLAGAEAAVRAVLQENSMQREARQLIKYISTLIARSENLGLTLATAFKKPLTVEFKDTDLKSVFEIIARTAGINFIFDKDVRQETKISIFVRDNSIEDVLKLLLMTNQLAHKALNDNSLLIYPNTPAKQNEYQELMVRSFHIAYTDVKQMVAMVRGLVKAKDIYVNESLNLFIMRDTPEAIRLVERLVALNDLPEPEVMLEVVVLEIQRDNNFALGPKLPTSATFSAVPGVTGVLPLNQFGFDGLKSFTMDSQARIDFEQSLTFADVLANPRIRVKNRETAKIHIGTREPIFTVTNTANVGSAASASFIDIGLKLDVEPIIGLNDDITMKVALEASNNLGSVPGPNGATAFKIGTRTAETLLTLRNGETQVLAGLIDDRDTRGVSGLAGLLNIPGLDRLLSNQSIKRTKTEIVLLITPRIIRNITQPTNLESGFHFGTANDAGKLPATIGKTAAKSLSMASAGTGGGVSGFRTAETLSLANRSEMTPNPFARNTASSPTITLQAPSNVSLGKEFSIRVGLVGAKASLTSDVELNYDSGMLELLDDGENSGTRFFKLGKEGKSGRTEQLRFKVIAVNAGTTEISIQSGSSEDSETGESVEVTLPSAASINLQ